jgi:hypothetical protein
MRTAKVYRPPATWKGQRTGDLDDFYVHDITGFILGGVSARALAMFPGVNSTEGLIGIPVGQDVRPGDRLLIGSDLFKVTGPREWGYENSLTGTQPRFYWLSLEGSTH